MPTKTSDEFKKKDMFGLFKKKSEADKMREKYESLMKEAFVLSKSDRTASDLKYAEADQLMKQLESLSKTNS